jgi:flagellar biosynthesis/type III secretory pathway chaperone
MHGRETTALFRRILQQETECAERLNDLLADERTALATGDLDSLGQLTAEKPALLQDLERWVAAHEGFLQAQGLASGREGSERFLSKLPDSASERDMWGRLQGLATACREANEINGSIVTLGRSRVQRALDVLRGGAQAVTTYGKAGEAKPSRAAQFIGKV